MKGSVAGSHGKNTVSGSMNASGAGSMAGDGDLGGKAPGVC